MTINQAGAYSTPDDLIDYTIISGTHNVTLSVADAADATLDPAATFVAVITNQCTPSSRVQPPSSDVAQPEAELLAAIVARQSRPLADTAAGSPAPTLVATTTTQPAIAITGNNADQPLQTALLLLGTGFSALALQRRRRDALLRAVR